MSTATDEVPVTQTFGAASEDIPVLDLAGYLAGDEGALEKVAAELRYALEEVGFFVIVNHGISQSLVDQMFAETERFHVLPESAKSKLAINRDNVGYMGNEGELPRTSPYYTGTLKPDVGECFFIMCDRGPRSLKIQNQWPNDLPGFRETLVEYYDALEELGRKILPIYATALDMPPDYFRDAFSENETLSVLRAAHMPPDELEDDQFNVGPHTDSSFFTLLAAADVPGLELLSQSGNWFPASPSAGSIVVNSGDMLTRWTNGRFLSTPHRVRNLSGHDRYSIPLFFQPKPDQVIECLPTCTTPDNPPKEPPITTGDYYDWFMQQNLLHAQDGNST